jgi:hypothetical protein
VNVEGCLACDANAGRIEVPGGTIAETEHWPPLHVHLVVYPRWLDDPDKALDLQTRRMGEGPPSADDAAAAAERLRAHLRKP